MDCNNTFPIDFAPNGILSGTKSFERVWLQSKFGMIKQNTENIFQQIFVCVYIDNSIYFNMFLWLKNNKKKWFSWIEKQ